MFCSGPISVSLNIIRIVDSESMSSKIWSQNPRWTNDNVEIFVKSFYWRIWSGGEVRNSSSWVPEDVTNWSRVVRILVPGVDGREVAHLFPISLVYNVNVVSAPRDSTQKHLLKGLALKSDVFFSCSYAKSSILPCSCSAQIDAQFAPRFSKFIARENSILVPIRGAA